MKLLTESIAAAAKKNGGITFVHSTDVEEHVSYHSLYHKAFLALGFLQQNGLQQGDELVIQVEDNKQFLIVFWACIIGGILPVPLSASGKEEQKLKLFTIWKYLNNPFFIADATSLEGLYRLPEQTVDTLLYKQVCSNTISLAELPNHTRPGMPAAVTEDDIAYIQFSSGSTGEPKGVCLTHKNLTSNIKDIIKSLAITSDDILLSWMPLTHDMGLIGFHLTGIYQDISTVSIATSSFIRKPAIWMDKTFVHGATVLYSPNFGLHYFLSSLPKDQAIEWNLSKVRIIVNGAEAIAENICRDFTERMKVYGLRDNVMLSAYGLAEASVEVSAMPPGSPLIIYWLHRDHLNIGESPVYLQPTANGSVSFVDVGRVVDHCRLRICDEEDQIVNEGVIGNIQISGANVTCGYYNNTAATRQAFTQDGWLRTGDIGFLQNERLVVTGRKKNIIIINGQNYYPQDIERIITGARITDQGKVVACGNRDEAGEKEELIIFMLFKGAYDLFLPAAFKVREVLLQMVGIYADKVIPVRRIPKTTSGKVQHFILLKQYKKGEFEEYMQFENAQSVQGIKSAKLSFAEPGPLVEQLRYLLGNADVEADTDLVRLGLNSLTATRLAARIEQLTGTHLPVHEIFAARTLNNIIQLLRASGGVRQHPPIDHTSFTEFPDMSAAQQRIWMECQLNNAVSAYNIPVVYKVSGQPDVALLEQCMRKLIEKYEILRTSFEWRKGKPQQHVHAYNDLLFACRYDDLRQSTAKDTEVGNIINYDVNSGFALDQPTQLRLRIIRTDEQEYILVLVVHHIIADGWSLSILFNEWCTLYNSQQTAMMPDKIWQYRDYVAWQQKYLQTEAAIAEKKYWLKELADLPDPVGINTQTAIHLNVAAGMRHHTYRFQKDDLLLLKNLAADYGTTPFGIMMSLLNVLIYRYTNQKDIVIGFDVAGRITAEIGQVIGYTLNTLCLRMQLNGKKSFNEIALAVKDKLFKALDHQLYPFEQLLADKEMNGERLFNILVLYQNFYDRQQLPSFAGCQLTEKEVFVHDGFMDMVITCNEDEDGLQLHVQYDVRQYAADEIVCFTKHLEMLLRSVANEPSKQIGFHELLTAGEKKILFPEDNSALIKHVRMPVHQLFERRATAFPDATAVVCGKQHLTYRSLNRMANIIAAKLKKHCNVQPDDRIGFCVDRNADMVIAMLAIMKAGAAYVAIDPDFPMKRIKQIVDDSEMKCMLTDASNFSSLEHIFEDGFLLQIDHNDLSDKDEENIPFEGSLDNLAYVIYTSGSTGKPKGVMITHDSLLHYVRQFIQYFGITKDDVVVQQSSVAFDTIIEEVFPALCCSARIAIAKKGGRDIEQLLPVITEHKATILSTTPLVLNELNKQVDSRLASLRLVISGGDLLHPSNIDRLINNVRVYNSYGPSEATVCTTYKEITDVATASLIGRPVPGYSVYILDENGQHLPVGKTGELFIGGALARGYLNLPTLTAEKFIANPHNPGERLYRSGDMGRYLASGDIEFTGRSDIQLKIRGHRVEPAEIEKLIAEHPRVETAAVVQVSNKDYLVAFITVRKSFPESELRSYLVDHLPSYMIPHRFEVINKMPYTTNGKVDRHALCKIAGKDTMQQKSRDIVRPVTDMEKKLVCLWQEVLGTEEISITDNFFSLGGHSIKVSQLLNRIYESTSISIKLPDVFRHPTILELAEKMASQEKETYQYIDIE